jgi:Protein of unknown function (DUF2807).
MKHTLSITAILLTLALLLSACSYGGVNFSVNTQAIKGSGTITTTERTVSDFSKVELSSLGNLTIKQGDTESLTIKADENLLPYITNEVDGDTLKIGMKPNTNIDPTQTIEYTLTVKSLTGITLSGFGNINADSLSGSDLAVRLSGSGDINVGEIDADSLEMHLTGFGNITVNQVKVANPDLELAGSGDLKINSLDAQKLALTISGLGTATVSGKTTDQTVRLSGSGNFHGDDLQSGSADVTISGLGDATVWATDSLDLNITGSGNVKYYGNPQLSQKITGLGSIKSLGSH